MAYEQKIPCRSKRKGTDTHSPPTNKNPWVYWGDICLSAKTPIVNPHSSQGRQGRLSPLPLLCGVIESNHESLSRMGIKCFYRELQTAVFSYTTLAEVQRYRYLLNSYSNRRGWGISRRWLIKIRFVGCIVLWVRVTQSSNSILIWSLPTVRQLRPPKRTQDDPNNKGHNFRFSILFDR